MSRFDLEATVQAIEKYKVDMWYSLAPMNKAILSMPGIQSRNLTSLRFNPSTSFGIPVTKDLADEWKSLTGCIKEMIKCSGYSVFPEDVEALMLNHPAVAQSAAVGVPDEKRGESVKLFVVLKSDYQNTLSEQDIIDWAKENMAAYKYPRYVEFRDSLPASGTGKLLRRLLKDPLPPSSQ